MFYPGETIVQSFIVPFYQEDVEKAIVSYKQNDHIVLEKEATSTQIYDDTDPNNPIPVEYTELVIVISQEESLLFENDMSYEIQINIFNMGNRQTSEPIKDKTGKQFYREVYTHEGSDNSEGPEEEPEEEVDDNAGQ